MKKKNSITTTIIAGGKSTGPMEGGIDPQKATAVMGSVIERAIDAAIHAAAEPKPAGKVKKIAEYLKYTFTEKELLEIGRNLGRSSHEIGRLEGELDAFKKQMNAQIARLEADQSVLAQQVTNGYEMRQIACEVRFNVPESKLKTIVRLDTMETVKVEAMDSYECQEELNFEKAAEQDEKGKEPPPETPAEAAAKAPVPEPEKPAEPPAETAPPA